jgi:hypothetical protein
MPRHADEPDSPSTPDRKNFVGSGNDPFGCLVCGAQVLPLENGSFRSHCPECLWSRHVDVVPGDRRSDCGGLMKPVSLEGSAGRGWVLVHACENCGFTRRNRTAERDPRQPDRWDRLVELSAERH